jgi:hypothetical protein
MHSLSFLRVYVCLLSCVIAVCFPNPQEHVPEQVVFSVRASTKCPGIPSINVKCQLASYFSHRYAFVLYAAGCQHDQGNTLLSELPVSEVACMLIPLLLPSCSLDKGWRNVCPV